jgi:HEAT repeat protein
MVDLIAQLNDLEEQSRRWAVRDLAEYPEATLALIAHVQTESSRAVREAVFTSLLRIGTEEVCESVAELLRSDDAELRNGAIDVLKNLADKAAPWIERLMTDPDPDVRIFAVNVMSSLRFEQVPEWLTTIVATDSHVNVCCTAIDLLAEVGDLDSIPALQSAEARFVDEPYVQFAVQTAVGIIQKTNVEWLISLTKERGRA